MAKLSDRDKEALRADALEVDEHNKKIYTQQQLADKYKISKGMVNRYVKESSEKSKQIIDAEVRVRGELDEIEREKSKQLSKQELIEVNKQVDKRTKHLEFFHNATLKNASVMVKKLDTKDGKSPDVSVYDHKLIQETLDKGMITMGLADRHAPKGDVNVAVSNTNNIANIDINDDMTDEEASRAYMDIINK